MRIKVDILIIISSIAVLNSYAQNLVPNPSFEVYSSCPTSFSQTNKATPWYDPTTGSSDYFNACAAGYANVPFCSTGYQYAKTGDAYAGLFALNGFGDGGREYIQVQLTSPLISDSCYFIEFYCNLYNDNGYSINKLGAYLSDTAIHYTGPGSISVLHYTPQIVSTAFLTDTLNWMHVSGYYHAAGGEKFLTIGDFKPFAPGDTLNTGLVGGYHGAYYFIDDVSITKVVGCDTTAGIHEINNISQISVFPNPNDGNMSLKYILKQSEKGTIKIFDVTGKLVNKEVLNSNDNQIQISINLDKGIYLYQIIVDDRIVKSDKIVIIR